MTRSTPTTSGTTSPPAPVGRLTRWKLTEAVRLYLWPVAGLLLVSGLVAGVRDSDWLLAGLLAAFAVLVWTAAAAARACVCSQKFVVQAALRARSQ